MMTRAAIAGIAFLGCLVFDLEPVNALEKISDLTQECLDCHEAATPGIVADWKKSLHALVTPADALKKPDLKRRITAASVPDRLANVVVGCAECHTLNPADHKDAFEHGSEKVHLTVTPKDCGVCHPDEQKQYEKNLMSHAWLNLAKNELYGTLEKAVNGAQSLKDMKTTIAAPDAKTNEDSCYHCHGTRLQVEGKTTRDTSYGELEFLVISGWPNQGVGRMNLDGTMGSCVPCHSRHSFSIEQARKPYTCSQCHKGPDVVAYKVYSVSKHGNIFFSLWDKWNFSEVPWTAGKDFTAPTCAACHVSLVVDADGKVVAKRTHQMADRIPWRIFGLPYGHPHPASPDTTKIRNKDGLPLPTALDGTFADAYLISEQERKERRETIQKVCLQCHASSWVNGHWDRFENAIKTTNAMTLTATEILQKAWDAKVADPSNLFDEAIEKQWMQQWFFYANSTRFASAMHGADYGVFAEGRWHLARTPQDMLDHLRFLLRAREETSESASNTHRQRKE
ncbi:MAG: multiheme c-type cytochrome [Thermodesulfobacteriota bacterium]